VDAHAGNSYAAWLAMGSPQHPGPEQITALQAAAQMPSRRHDLAVDADGVAHLEVTLSGQSVKFLDVRLR
jgi:beta-xylosidase